MRPANHPLQSTPIRSPAALQPPRQGPSAANGVSARSAGAIHGGGAKAPLPERDPGGRDPTFILLTLEAAGKGRTSARTSYIHQETLARVVPSAPRVTGAAQWRARLLRQGVWSGGVVRGVALLSGQAPVLPRARVRALGSCLGQASDCHCFFGMLLARESVP